MPSSLIIVFLCVVSRLRRDILIYIIMFKTLLYNFSGMQGHAHFEKGEECSVLSYSTD